MNKREQHGLTFRHNFIQSNQLFWNNYFNTYKAASTNPIYKYAKNL